MSNEELVSMIQTGQDTKENMLLLWGQCERFITMLARRYIGPADLEDLQQEGYLALCEAANRYQGDKGIAFINYAAYWIKDYMRRYITNFCKTIRVSSNSYDWIRKYKKTVAAFSQQYNQLPADSDVCRLMGIKPGKLTQIKQDMQTENLKSLDASVGGEDGELMFKDVIPDDVDLEGAVVYRADQERIQAEVQAILAELGPEEQAVIHARYFDNLTLEETGKFINVDGRRARSIQGKALRVLRTPENQRRLRPYCDEYLLDHVFHHVGVEQFQRTGVSATEWVAFKCLAHETK